MIFNLKIQFKLMTFAQRQAPKKKIDQFLQQQKSIGKITSNVKKLRLKQTKSLLDLFIFAIFGDLWAPIIEYLRVKIMSYKSND